MEHNSKLTKRAQTLRKAMTKEEKRLWYEYLRNYPHRFRRQVTCGNYILDFYCAAAKLAIELDGSQHYEPAGQAYDARRDAYLERQGILVLRFSNSDVKATPHNCVSGSQRIFCTISAVSKTGNTYSIPPFLKL